MARQRLVKLTQGVIDELAANVEQEKRDATLIKQLTKKDKKYEKYLMEMKANHAKTQDTKDVENMIQNFELNMENMAPQQVGEYIYIGCIY